MNGTRRFDCGARLGSHWTIVITSILLTDVFELAQDMASDDEVDPIFLGRSASHQTLQNLLFPRSRAIMDFMPLTSPSTLRRNSSFRYSFGSRPDYQRHRSQALLERHRTPSHSWDKFRKSDEELRAIKKKKVRDFYENQVSHVTRLLTLELSYR